MAPKQQLDKAAWQWAETVEPESVTKEHMETAYRIHLKTCKRGACRRNCKGNPHCLNCLGEREWLGEIDDSNWHDIEDPQSERRKENAFVGLKNLGATCYVNTYLQVWFHNPAFRAAIYQYRDEDNIFLQNAPLDVLQTSLSGAPVTSQSAMSTSCHDVGDSLLNMSNDTQKSKNDSPFLSSGNAQRANSDSKIGKTVKSDGQFQVQRAVSEGQVKSDIQFQVQRAISEGQVKSDHHLDVQRAVNEGQLDKMTTGHPSSSECTRTVSAISDVQCRVQPAVSVSAPVCNSKSMDSGNQISSGAGSISGAHIMASGSNQSVSGAGSVSGADTMASGSNQSVSGAGLVSGAHTMASGSNQTVSGAGSVSGAHTMASGSNQSVSGAGLVSGAHTMASGSNQSVSGAGSDSGAHTMASGSNQSVSGAGSVSGAHTMVSGSNQSVSGAGSVSGAHTMASGSNQSVSGAGSVSGAHTMVSGSSQSVSGDQSEVCGGQLVSDGQCVVNGVQALSSHSPVSTGHSLSKERMSNDVQSTATDVQSTARDVQFSESDNHAQSSSDMEVSGTSVKDIKHKSHSGVQPMSSNVVREYEPKSPCGHLQLIFALLQDSDRRFIDPSGLIHCLGLDAGQQQDAQEFCKLFMSLLEESLSTQPDTAVQHIVQQQFSGQYAYVTRCQGCGRCSERMSEFNELDLNIKGHRELTECIEEFLEEEKLEGDNMYMCQQCSSKQNATRKIKLRSLPPVLNLQLLRFVFDRTSGHKKKLNTYIQFPELLDMSRYVEMPDGSVQYDLSAVLIHRGPSAYSGHYIAHIQDESSGSWHKFNDEEIEKMGGKKLQLGNEDEIPDTSNKGPAKPKAAKGFHASRNAYMLVYRRRDFNQGERENREVEPVKMPEWLKKCVLKDNAKFEEWVQDMTTMRDKNVAMGRARHQEILTLYDKMEAKQGEAFEWMETAWISKWLQDDLRPPAVDNSSLLCTHNRINPDKVPQMKCISLEAAETIYSKYQGSPRLSSDQMCMDCVRERCRVIRTKARMTEDSKFITGILKSKTDMDGPDSYWVGKASLRSWKRLVLEELESSLSKDGASSPKVEGQGEQIILSGRSERDSLDGDGPDKVGFCFNEDALCETHGNLSTDLGCRRLVSADIWSRLKVYFPTAPEFLNGTEPCPLCTQIEREILQAQQEHKMLAMTQRNSLPDLLHWRNRPVWKNGVTVLNIVNRGFLEQWGRFIRDPLKFEDIPSIQNSLLLCPHRGFMFQPAQLDGKADIVSLVWPEEWDILKKNFTVDVEITLKREVEEDSGTMTFSTTPETCSECCLARLEQEQQERQQYKDCKIFVRKVTPDFKNGAVSSAENSDRDDPEFLQANGAKRKKGETVSSVPEKLLKLDSGHLRRSGRHRKVRGEKDFVISSDHSLRDLKLQIMRQFSVAPFDQHLMLDGRLLTDDQAKLGALNILPGDVLYLKVDEPTEEALMMDDLARASFPEQGFKGTGLHGGIQQ